MQQDEVIPGSYVQQPEVRAQPLITATATTASPIWDAVSLLHRQPMHTGKVTIVSVAWQAHRATTGMVVETMIRKSTTATATGSSQGLAGATPAPAAATRVPPRNLPSTGQDGHEA